MIIIDHQWWSTTIERVVLSSTRIFKMWYILLMCVTVIPLSFIWFYMLFYRPWQLQFVSIITLLKLLQVLKMGCFQTTSGKLYSKSKYINSLIVTLSTIYIGITYVSYCHNNSIATTAYNQAWSCLQFILWFIYSNLYRFQAPIACATFFC